MKFPTLLEVVATDVDRDRAPVSRGLCEFSALKERTPGLESRIDREGGKYGAGIIRGVAVLTKGEAVGHEQWIDEETLSQAESLIGPKGVKSRFAHPSMSGDGLGTTVGRVFDAYRIGPTLFGDFHVMKTSRNTPDGDLGGYVMNLAEEDPEAFGMSIAFRHDFDAEDDFLDENGGTGFKSPDPENVNNFPHVRIESLSGADFVDQPAANPNGLFHRGPTHDVLTQAEGLIEYVLGLSDQVPKETGGLSAERLKGFVNRFLDGRGMQLSVSNKEQGMKTGTKLNDQPIEETAPETEAPEKAEAKPEASSETQETSGAAEASQEASESLSKADVKKFSAKFGAEKGMKYLLDGVSFEEALSIEFDALKAKKEITAGLERGEESPVGTNFSEGGKKANGVLPKGVESFAKDVIRMPGAKAFAN